MSLEIPSFGGAVLPARMRLRWMQRDLNTWLAVGDRIFPLLTILAKSSVRVSIHINKRHASSGHLITNDDEMMRYLKL
jgi:hypothetical protein